ncbi:MAG: hypothetical protein Q4G21_03305 [Dermabacter sp.]|nr:hypothetical protein [Dermabacter sp.]
MSKQRPIDDLSASVSLIPGLNGDPEVPADLLLPDAAAPGASWHVGRTPDGQSLLVFVVRGEHAVDAADEARRAQLVTAAALVPILGVEEFYEADGTPLTAVMYEDPGVESLADLTEAGALRPETARAIAGQVTDALETARQKGVRHFLLDERRVFVDIEHNEVRILGAGVEAAATDADAWSDDPFSVNPDVRSIGRVLFVALAGRGPEFFATPEVLDPSVVSPRTVPADLALLTRTLLSHEAGTPDHPPYAVRDVRAELAPWQSLPVTLEAFDPEQHAGAPTPLSADAQAGLAEGPGANVGADGDKAPFVDEAPTRVRAVSAVNDDTDPKLRPVPGAGAVAASVAGAAAGMAGAEAAGAGASAGLRPLPMGGDAPQKTWADALGAGSTAGANGATGPGGADGSHGPDTDPDGSGARGAAANGADSNGADAGDDSWTSADTLRRSALLDEPDSPTGGGPILVAGRSQSLAASIADAERGPDFATRAPEPGAAEGSEAEGAGDLSASRPTLLPPSAVPHQPTPAAGPAIEVRGRGSSLAEDAPSPMNSPSLLRDVVGVAMAADDPQSLTAGSGGSAGRGYQSKIILGLAILLVILGVVFAITTVTSPGRDRGVTSNSTASASATAEATDAAEPAETTEPTEEAPAAQPATLAGVSVVYPPDPAKADYPENAALMTDGDPGTAWTTQRYVTPDYGRMREGMGVRLTLDPGGIVNEVVVTAGAQQGGTIELRPVNEAGEIGEPIASGELTAGAETVLKPEQPIEATDLVLWAPTIGAVDGGYRLEIAEVRVN